MPLHSSYSMGQSTDYRGVGELSPGPSGQVSHTSALTTILCVDDDSMVRGYVEDILTEEGYQVLLASTAEEALATVQDFRGPIHLLLTDIVMPGLNGRQLAEQLSPVRQDTKVLFMSGYTDDAIIREGIQLTRVEFLAKPFSPSLLLQRVTRVLAQSSPRPLPPT